MNVIIPFSIFELVLVNLLNDQACIDHIDGFLAGTTGDPHTSDVFPLKTVLHLLGRPESDYETLHKRWVAWGSAHIISFVHDLLAPLLTTENSHDLLIIDDTLEGPDASLKGIL